MKQINSWGFWGVLTILFIMILYKALHIPITHDETATAVHYTRFRPWQIMMFPDNWPNNHILNTLMTRKAIRIFHNYQWVIRLPNLLLFPFFAFGVWRIVKANLPKTTILFLPATLIFIANPYLLDFFGLCRGYGMSVALATFAASFLITGYTRSNSKHIWWAFFFSILAAYANFTLLVFWVATTILCAFYFLQTNKFKFKQFINPLLTLTIGCILFLLLIIIPIYKMQTTNQFEYWSSKGFYQETILSLVKNWQYDSRIFSKHTREPIAILSLVLIVFNLAIASWRYSEFKLSLWKQPIFISTAIVVLTALVSVLQSILLHTPNLNGRTALFFYPLFSIAVVGTLGLAQQYFRKRTQYLLTGLITVVCLFHLIDRYNPNATREWWYDEHTLQVLQVLEEREGTTKNTLKTNWMFHPSFDYYFKIQQIPSGFSLMAYDKEIKLDEEADYYYVFDSDYEPLKPYFEVVQNFNGRLLLVNRKKLDN